MVEKINENAELLIVANSEFDFWLNEEDNIYDEKY